MKIFFSILPFFALLAAVPARGESRLPVPESYRGAWAAPDCGRYDEALLIGRNFYLHVSENSADFHPVHAKKNNADYDTLDIGGTRHPVITTEDSLLIIADMEGVEEKDWGNAWEALYMAGRSEYTGCHNTPTLIPLPLVTVMDHVDDVAAACAEEIDPECKDLLFTLADTNKNGRLSQAEFKKAGSILSTFAPIAGGGEVQISGLETAYKQGIADGAAVFLQALHLRDKDGSGDLDKTELENILSVLSAPALRGALVETGKVFAPFAEAAKAMPVTAEDSR